MTTIGHTSRSRSWRRALTLLAFPLLLAACVSSAEAPEAVVTDPLAVSPTPGELRDQVREAVANKDEASLKVLWPVEAWDALAGDPLDDFSPSTDNGDCDQAGDDTSVCFIFDENRPFVLGLTMELGDSGWLIRTVTLDSTN